MKKNAVKVLSVSAVLIFAAAVIFLQQGKTARTAYTKNMFAMNTVFVLKAYGPEAEEALREAGVKIQELEKAFSVTVEGSDLWKINHAEAQQTEAQQTEAQQTEAQQTEAQQIGAQQTEAQQTEAQQTEAQQTGAQQAEKRPTEEQQMNETKVCPDTLSVLETALQLGDETGGALDISVYPVLRAWGFTADQYRIPGTEELESLLKNVDYRQIEADAANCTVRTPKGMELDFGSLAKGYAGDCLADILRKAGVTSAILDLGGNEVLIGTKPDGSPWRVAVKNPFNPAEELGVLQVTDCTVVTSGSYERFFTGEDGRDYWHILDPADGYPADSGLVSVTVVGESGVRCDGLSTALFVMGREKAVSLWREKQDFDMILVTDEGRLYITEGLKECFQEREGWNAEIIAAER